MSNEIETQALSDAETAELQPGDVAALPPETLEKIENAQTPDEVDEAVKEAIAEGESASGATEPEADQQNGEDSNSDQSAEAATEQASDIPVI